MKYLFLKGLCFFIMYEHYIVLNSSTMICLENPLPFPNIYISLKSIEESVIAALRWHLCVHV